MTACEGGIGGERGIDRGENRRRLRHPARPELAAGHLARIRAHDQRAEPAQGFEIALRRRMLPHAHVHRGREQNTLVGREEKCARQIVGKPARELGHQIGGRRGHDDEIGAAGELDMPHFRLGGEVEELALHAGPGDGRDRQRGHELAPGPRQDRHDPGPGLAEQTHELDALVGGNTAANDEEDLATGKHFTSDLEGGSDQRRASL